MPEASRGNMFIEKYNPYHGPDGRFTSAQGASLVSITNAKAVARMRAQHQAANATRANAGRAKPPAPKGRMNVDTVRTTEKGGALIRDENGREGWMQSRWIKDGHVNKDVAERAFAAKKSADDARSAVREWRNARHSIPKPDRETEKAIGVRMQWYENNSGQGGERLVWFPKSQISEGKAPGWLIQAKAQDLRDSLTSQRGVAFEMRIGEHTIFPQ